MVNAKPPGAASTTKKRAERVSKPIYPKGPETDHPHFWLAHYLRDAAEFEAFQAHYLKVGAKSHWVNTPLLNALSETSWRKAEEVSKAARQVQADGLLPFAWSHTRVLDGVPA